MPSNDYVDPAEEEVEQELKEQVLAGLDKTRQGSGEGRSAINPALLMKRVDFFVSRFAPAAKMIAPAGWGLLVDAIIATIHEGDALLNPGS